MCTNLTVVQCQWQASGAIAICGSVLLEWRRGSMTMECRIVQVLLHFSDSCYSDFIYVVWISPYISVLLLIWLKVEYKGPHVPVVLADECCTLHHIDAIG